MLHRERLNPPEHIYPIDEWRLIETEYYPRFLAATETLFATANGFLGMRGTCEEGQPVANPGTFINGFHETWPIVYGEDAFGFAKTGQTMVNVTDGKLIRLYVDDEPLCLADAMLLKFERVLDMRAGTLDREVIWETYAGKQVRVWSRRLVSFEYRHLAAIDYTVSVLNADADVVLSSELVYDHRHQTAQGDPRRGKGLRERPLVPVAHHAEGRRLMLGHSTAHSGMQLACGASHILETDCKVTEKSTASEDAAKVVFNIQAKRGCSVRLTKYLAYHVSERFDNEDVRERSERTLEKADHGFDGLLESQRRYLDRFWSKSDVRIKGDLFFQRCLRWNLFQLCQASARCDGHGVPARGLTGQTYEGHYFWDSEIYVLPFLIYTAPAIARRLLKFRYQMLDKARARASEVGENGALFPWRTINGEEASAYYAAGTAQYHINADIMYALRKYVGATGDEEFLFREGAEMLVETARMWRGLGFFSDRKGGAFCIHAVTGPDEYATVVNNNTFTNLMARENLRYAVETVARLREERPHQYRELVSKTALADEEVAEWRQAADRMFVPYDEALGVHPQDDSFLDREIWDFENTPADHYPLLLHFHPLQIYRHQVIKQADVVLATFLLGHEFTREQKQRNFDYYDPITTGDSSLSVSIQSIMAGELGYVDKALSYFRYAALMDLADVGGNVGDGAHIASIGGSWMAVVYGAAGLRDFDGQLRFNPYLIRRLSALELTLTVRGNVLDVCLLPDQVVYTLRQGSGLTLYHRDERIDLSPENPSASRSGTRDSVVE